VTQLFWLQQKVVQNTKYEIMNIFIRSSRDPRQKANDPQVENHCSRSMVALGILHKREMLHLGL